MIRWFADPGAETLFHGRFARRLPSGIQRVAQRKLRQFHYAEELRDLPPIHPGEQLREEFVKPLGLTAYRLAKDIGVPVTRVQAILAERRGISGDMARALFWHHSRVLAEHAARLSIGKRSRRAGFAPRRRNQAARGLRRNAFPAQTLSGISTVNQTPR